MAHYRIGDFAKKLGVTPDFLKYYEKVGILQPEVASSGYRYYSFAQSAKVFECIKLRNCGFSSQDIVKLINSSSFSEYLTAMNTHGDQIRKTVNYEQALLSVLQEMTSVEPLFYSENNWEVRQRGGFYFFPYSVQDHMLEDLESSALLTDWLPWMPVVKNCIQYYVSAPQKGCYKPDMTQLPTLGLSAPEAFVQSQGLLHHAPAEYLPPCRCLIMYLRSKRLGRRAQNEAERRCNPTNAMANVVAEHSFTITGNCFSHTLAVLDEPDGCYTYSVMGVPIA